MPDHTTDKATNADNTNATASPDFMDSDYLFRAVLQSNNLALTGLVCSLLHLESEKVQSVEITNPIILGHAVDEKEFFPIF